MSEAEQPMPLRLNVFTPERIWKRLHAIAHRLGVGLNSEQLMMKKSTSLGCTPVRSKRLSRHEQITVSASSRAAFIDWSCGTASCWHRMIPGGHAVESPVPLLTSTLRINSSSVSWKEPAILPAFFSIVMMFSRVEHHSAGGSKSAKSSR